MMGVLPLQFEKGQSAKKLGLTGREKINVEIDENVKPHDLVKVTATSEDGTVTEFNAIARFDSEVEIDYYRHGGILQIVLRQKLNAYFNIKQLFLYNICFFLAEFLIVNVLNIFSKKWQSLLLKGVDCYGIKEETVF